MSTLRDLVTRIPAPRPEAEQEKLERLWGIAVCRQCGTTIILGESAGGGVADLCAACQVLPSAPTMDYVEAAATRQRTGQPSAANARLRDAA